MKKLFIYFLAITCFISMIGLTACKKDESPDETNTHQAINAEHLTTWINSINLARTVSDNYTSKFDGKTDFIYGDNTKESYLSQGEEARAGNKFYATMKEYQLGSDNSKNLQDEELSAIKLVDDNGTTRTKRYESVKIYRQGSTHTQIRGTYVAPDQAKTRMEYNPSQTVDNLDLTDASSYDDVKETFASWWLKAGGNSTDTITYLSKKNDDNSISLTFTVEYSMERIDDDNDNYTLSSTESFEYIVKDNSLFKYIYSDTQNHVYPNNADKNYIEKNNQASTFTYNAFDESFYNSIDVSTETTEHTYVGYVKIYYNGYICSSSMYVPVGDSFNAEDVKHYLVDWNRNSYYNALIASEDYSDSAYDNISDEEKAEWIKESQEKNAKFMSAMELYTDPEMTTPFSNSLTINEYQETFTIYIKLTAPEEDAWVISVLPSTNENTPNQFYIYMIQGCAHQQNGTLTFNANLRLSYNVVSVDGNEPNADGQYVFEKGTIHIFVLSKN